MSKLAQTSWDDIRFVLAVADHGSVSAAARELSVNHATVLRRISAFESKQGLRIFDKTPRGYQVSADRRPLIEAMREAGVSLAYVDQMIEAERPQMEQGIRLTSTDSICLSVLPPIIASMPVELGSIIDVIIGNAHLDLARLQAHITVRPTLELPQDLSGERAGAMRFGVFAAPNCHDAWMGLSGPLSRSHAAEWVRVQSPNVSIVADSFVMLAALAAEGKGKTILPVFLGDTWPGLERLDLPTDLKPIPIWVASHVDFARSGRLRRARKHIVQELKAREPLLMG